MSLVFQQSDSFPEKIGLKYLQLYNSIKSHATTSLKQKPKVGPMPSLTHFS